jgi:hypothetical protein
MDYSVERVDGGESEYQSSTEKYGIIRIEYRELVEQVEMVLSLLSDDERNLFKKTYFKIDSPPIDIIYERLCISRRSYFRIKQQALIKIATILRKPWHFFGTILAPIYKVSVILWYYKVLTNRPNIKHSSPCIYKFVRALHIIESPYTRNTLASAVVWNLYLKLSDRDYRLGRCK